MPGSSIPLSTRCWLFIFFFFSYSIESSGLGSEDGSRAGPRGSSHGSPGFSLSNVGVTRISIYHGLMGAWSFGFTSTGHRGWNSKPANPMIKPRWRTYWNRNPPPSPPLTPPPFCKMLVVVGGHSNKRPRFCTLGSSSMDYVINSNYRTEQ